MKSYPRERGGKSRPMTCSGSLFPGWEPLCSILCLSRVTRLSPAKRHTLPSEYLMV